ncbi:chemotaxis protein CheW [Pararoseomonas indoligenes]|uniref:Chemotaxis protein CheW n=1 Tax=Roseomonas indoligenes TaxID=2820811 RepID=A0A940MWZ0_9PROT|nr:chemotaxis protein CheW [Pararoseomonas indoligenes]MBP0492016.1 chemotaxis protein CheW [Pararoseomonas indoligenes]
MEAAIATGTAPARRAAVPAPTDTAVLTLTVAGQLCGVPVLGVRDILGPQTITPIPLAPPEVAGGLNLRGRIVTAVDLRRRLGLAPREPGAPFPMSVVVEGGGELYALLADSVGEVLALPDAGLAPNPPTLDPLWREVCAGVHQHAAAAEPGGTRLLIMLDVERVLDIG